MTSPSTKDVLAKDKANGTDVDRGNHSHNGVHNGSTKSQHEQSAKSANAEDSNQKSFYGESSVNLALLDPPRWGWTAAGGIADLLTPHERARRKAAKKAFVRNKRNRDATCTPITSILSTPWTKSVNKQSAPTAESLTQDATSLDTIQIPFAGQSDSKRKEGLQNGRSTTISQHATSSLADNAITTDKPSSLLDGSPILSDANRVLEPAVEKEVPESATAEEKSHSSARSKKRQKKTSKLQEPPAPVRFTALCDIGASRSEQGDGQRQQQRLDADRVLDIYTYHRGREGMEFRDQETGDLLCDVEPTDTNFARDGPSSLVCRVAVEFPLEDEPSTAVAGNPTADDAAGPGIVVPESEMVGVRFFRDTIEWDLSDAQTPTPQIFAADVAECYGLSYSQTLDLAESIQRQLYTFIRDHCAYAPPWTLSIAPGLDREEGPVPHAYALYGDVSGSGLPGGAPLPPVSRRPSRPTLVRSSSSTNRTTTARSKGPLKRRRESKTPPNQRKVEDIYREEVQLRLRAESTKQLRGDRSSELLSGEIKVSEMKRCHVCLGKNDRCGTFACGNPDHSYCETHLSERHGLSLQTDVVPLTLEYCPICSLACDCISCSKLLDAVAMALKQKSAEQNCQPTDTVFENLLDYSTTVKVRQKKDEERASARRKIASKNKKGNFRRSRSVPKVPVSELPREMFNNTDLDPGTEEEYRTIYTAVGPTIVDEAQAEQLREKGPFQIVESNNHIQTTEDGTIDHCIVCRTVGDLICCDYCPRAYHPKCSSMAEGSKKSQTGATWECPACVYERSEPAEDKIDGAKSLKQIASVYGPAEEDLEKGSLDGLRVLSVIHEMLLRLMDYDFGYVFRDPVDPDQVPEYYKVVKKPMDLGTIESRLSSGDYARADGPVPLDHIPSLVLKDIELVWHNCFTFNFPGSAIYRMAEVQRKLANRMRRRSLNLLLSKKTASEVDAFQRICEDERSKAALSVMNGAVSDGSHAADRNEVSVGKSVTKARRFIAVLDPDTGLIVKFYTTVQAVCAVVNLLIRRQYNCEYDFYALDIYNNVRSIIRESAANASLRLFGYRWVFYDMLQEGNVVFPDAVPQNAAPEVRSRDEKTKKRGERVEMIQDGKSHTFASVEEALSFAGISHETGSEGPTLSEGTFSDFANRSFRLLADDRRESELLCLHPSFQGATQSDKSPENGRSTQWTGSRFLFFKEDRINGRRVGGFENLDEAYQDWLSTLKKSKLSKETSMTRETFGSFYLDGDRNVAGMSWVSNAHELH